MIILVAVVIEKRKLLAKDEMKAREIGFSPRSFKSVDNTINLLADLKHS